MRLRFLGVIATAAITSLATLFVVSKTHTSVPFWTVANGAPQHTPAMYAGYTPEGAVTLKSTPLPDFQQAAEASVKAVVHIKTSTKARTVAIEDGDDFFGQLFGQRQYSIPGQIGSGSGVVISADGYIVTNNHVIDGADEVTVTFNNRYTTTAKVISKDASTDLAVIKVSEKNLDYMEFGNSDDVHLGQWVLAVGYPLTLDATVTAGIVSAKSRSLGMNSGKSKAPIESYIQTDAAVNPGNSGGALVNTNGQLIGINAAIASPTGAYAGYSYAIPANIVRKAVNDMVKYGAVQRGYLGIQYVDPRSVRNDELKKLGIDKSDGVYIASVNQNSGAALAGLQKGDYITDINGNAIHTESDLQGEVARYQPGDNITVTYNRGGKTYKTTLQLRNAMGNTSVGSVQNTYAALGAEFRELNDKEKAKYEAEEGIIVNSVGNGKLAKETAIRDGFVVYSVNGNVIRSLVDLQLALSDSNDLQIAGSYPGKGGMYYYNIKGSDGQESVTDR